MPPVVIMQVLGDEVAQDVDLARAQRATHADLLAALVHPQAGHADDAAGGDQQQQHASPSSASRPSRGRRDSGRCGPGPWMLLRDHHAAGRELEQGRFGFLHDAIALAGLGAHREASNSPARDASPAIIEISPRSPACVHGVCRRSTTPTMRSGLRLAAVADVDRACRPSFRVGNSFLARASVTMACRGHDLARHRRSIDDDIVRGEVAAVDQLQAQVLTNESGPKYIAVCAEVSVCSRLSDRPHVPAGLGQRHLVGPGHRHHAGNRAQGFLVALLHRDLLLRRLRILQVGACRCGTASSRRRCRWAAPRWPGGRG